MSTNGLTHYQWGSKVRLTIDMHGLNSPTSRKIYIVVSTFVLELAEFKIRKQ